MSPICLKRTNLEPQCRFHLHPVVLGTEIAMVDRKFRFYSTPTRHILNTYTIVTQYDTAAKMISTQTYSGQWWI